MKQLKDLRNVGDVLWFEYHCWESLQSGDAKLWLHSHQQVTVISEANFEGIPWHEFFKDDDNCETLQDRSNIGMTMNYKVRFADGWEYDVFEDELLDSKEQFCRADPPVESLT